MRFNDVSETGSDGQSDPHVPLAISLIWWRISDMS
jgi:hypothetical protein